MRQFVAVVSQVTEPGAQYAHVWVVAAYWLDRQHIPILPRVVRKNVTEHVRQCVASVKQVAQI